MLFELLPLDVDFVSDVIALFLRNDQLLLEHLDETFCLFYFRLFKVYLGLAVAI